jgi:hypothetical protein
VPAWINTAQGTSSLAAAIKATLFDLVIDTLVTFRVAVAVTLVVPFPSL